MTTTTDTARRRSLLHWLGRRRRGVETLPPVRVNLTANIQSATAALRAAGAATPRISAAAETFRASAETYRAAADVESEPRRPRTEHLCDELDAVVDPAAAQVWRGTYTVTLSRLRGTGARPAPLEVHVESADQLAAAIALHVQEHVGDSRPVEVTVDPLVRGGILRTGTWPIGAFSYAATADADREGR